MIDPYYINEKIKYSIHYTMNLAMNVSIFTKNTFNGTNNITTRYNKNLINFTLIHIRVHQYSFIILIIYNHVSLYLTALNKIYHPNKLNKCII